MQVEYLIQNGKENSLVNSLVESFSKKPKKVYMFLVYMCYNTIYLNYNKNMLKKYK